MNSQPKLGDRVKDCAEMNPVLALRPENEDEIFSNSQGNLEALDVLFSRYRRTLLLVAYRVLGDPNQAEDAVQRCLQSAASRNVPRFENEGAFRSWLVRVLIDVALFILQEREWAARILRTDHARIRVADPNYGANKIRSKSQRGTTLTVSLRISISGFGSCPNR